MHPTTTYSKLSNMSMPRPGTQDTSEAYEHLRRTENTIADTTTSMLMSRLPQCRCQVACAMLRYQEVQNSPCGIARSWTGRNFGKMYAAPPLHTSRYTPVWEIISAHVGCMPPQQPLSISSIAIFTPVPTLSPQFEPFRSIPESKIWICCEQIPLNATSMPPQCHLNATSTPPQCLPLSAFPVPNDSPFFKNTRSGSVCTQSLGHWIRARF